jgi:hypothetical protein
MRRMFPAVRRFATFTLVSVTVITAAGAQDPIDNIRETDLKADLFTLAGDAMRGREAGTLDELTASSWIVERARAAGLQPAGDNGTYLQLFPLERMRVSLTSHLVLGGHALAMGRDVVPEGVFEAALDAPVVVSDGDAVGSLALKDKVLAVRYAPSSQPSQDAGPRTVPALRAWVRRIRTAVAGSPPSAVVAIVPDAAEDQWNRVAIGLERGSYGLDPERKGISCPRDLLSSCFSRDYERLAGALRAPRSRSAMRTRSSCRSSCTCSRRRCGP